ncbi:MAG TPA: hypothetical protein PKK23_15780 [Nitrospirales bacterium]|nr:hypothetical protein [Nitrospiraceae bacterium]HNP30506.1 hypothetical protein [Nitrospirales bacterium]
MKPSTTVQSAAEPRQTALDNLRTLDETLTNFRHKKNILEQEIVALGEGLDALEQSRPQLLESVLAGTQPESTLTEQELEAARLKAELISKKDLLTLVETQIQAKAQSRVNLVAQAERLMGPIYRAIEQDLMAQWPPDFLPYFIRLEVVARMNSRRGLSILEDMMPALKHGDLRRKLAEILSEYGISR